MDRNHHPHCQPAAVHHHHHQQSQHPPQHPHNEQPSSTPTQDMQLYQQADATPQDVLTEARKNLQVLIDSGLSKDLLHQWVDENLSLQLAFPNSLQAFASTPPPQAHAHAQAQAQSLSQPALTPRTAQTSSSPTCPLTASPGGHIPPATLSSTPTPLVTISAPVPSSNSPSLTPTVSSSNIKTEPSADDASPTWSASTLAASPRLAPTTDQSTTPTSAGESDTAMFLPPTAPFSHSHRPRISISSVSSGSSGHASIWSTNSAQSTFSWHSATTGGRSMAPLPMPPAPGPSALNASHANGLSRQNIYWCTSCETSFKRKYDWKRHEDEFHERWRKYPCPEPGCNRSFWGSNSFNQHHKQCHGCKTCPHAEQVVKFLRKRKYWACGFCSALHPARERHVEHVARHFESGLTKGDWMHSRVVYGLLHQPLIREAWDALLTSKQAEYAGRRPQFSWHPSKTGRAQGFLEHESDGQLQDLLEFFSGDDGEAQWIVGSAYELADIVLTSAPTMSAQFSTPVAASRRFAPADAQASYTTLPPQPSAPSMLSSSSPSSTNGFASNFRNTLFANPQQFASSSRASPDSTSQSPLPSAHSPMMPTHGDRENRDLPQIPPSSMAPADSMMDFEYSPAPVAFEDWESLARAVITDTSPHQPNGNAQGEWGIMQYFGDPRVTS